MVAAIGRWHDEQLCIWPKPAGLEN
eukprot:SAG11_NODE_9929_length_869_cov_0.961039_1_plen_24_part_10